MSVRFNYLYRDAGNWKKFDEVIFANPNSLGLVEIDLRLRQLLHPDMLFMAHQVHIPEIFLYSSESEVNVDDHCFHEFDSVELTDEQQSDTLGRTIDEFLEKLEFENRKIGWKVFDPCNRFELREHFKTLG